MIATVLDEMDRVVAARMARRSILDRDPLPSLSFVQEEVTLRRPVGGALVLRRQRGRRLELGRLRNVAIQVMPTHCEEHPGTGGLIEVLKFPDGSTVGRSEGAFSGRPVSDSKQLRILGLRDGNDCVEIASVPGQVHVRDSKNLSGPRLTFGADAWAGFILHRAGH